MFNTKACVFRALLTAVAIVSPVFAGPMKAIIGGVESTIGQFPYFVHYRYCGAALIAPDIVLTAAHCGFDGEDDFYVGAYERGETTGGAEIRQCVTLVNDTDWDDDTFDHDFALCKLNEPVTIDESLVTLEVNEDPSFPSVGTDVIVMGLGGVLMHQTDDGWDNTMADTLKNLTLDVVSNDECNRIHTTLGDEDDRILDSMLCALHPSGGQEDMCSGDSGGPLVVRSYQGDGTFKDILVGVVSWGGCWGDGRPSVYARTSSAVDWIRTTACETLNSVADFCPQSPTTSTTPSPTPSTPPAPTSSSKSEKKSSKKSKSGKKTKSTKAPTRAPTAAPTKTSKKTKKSGPTHSVLAFAVRLVDALVCLRYGRGGPTEKKLLSPAGEAVPGVGVRDGGSAQKNRKGLR